MKKVFTLTVLSLFALCLVLAGLSSSASAAGDRSDLSRRIRSMSLDYQAREALRSLDGLPQAPGAGLDQAPNAGWGAGPLAVVIVPEFHYTRTAASDGDVGGGTTLYTRSGHSETGSFLFTATKPITDMFSLGFFYQFALGKYTGGMMVPDEGGLASESDVHVTAHVLGVLGNFNLGSYGRLETSVLEAFDSYGGSETQIVPALGIVDSRAQDAFSDRVLSLMAFYVNDFKVGENFTLSPYLGWRSVYVVIVGQTDWSSQARGDLLPNHDAWAHLATGGLKGTWSLGRLNVTARLGANYRVSKDDIPGFASRAVAPGVAHLGWNNNWNRAIGTWGLGFSYVFPEICVLDVGYNGFAGADTSAHNIAAALVFPF
ncbi:MAG: hypothetical protein LBO05_09885 [Deltaproteobacteria bacterium]|jgi:hypothetical protein|nr:hypothetical protein [Deltaproteobacteria bacterium]